MNAPLKKAILTLRPDLTLQLAVGDLAHDVELTPADAYDLAMALLATMADLSPWAGRRDAMSIERVHGLGYEAMRVAALVQSVPALPTDKQAVIEIAVERALTALVLLEAIVPTLPGEKDGKTR